MSVRKGGYVIAGTPRTTGGVEIGDIGFAPLGIDESLNLRRYLNGQVISQSQFVSFTNKIKATAALFPSLTTTETNWQAEKTNSKLGQCGKFVVDDTAQTIRLPCVVNAQGLVDLALIGGIKNESLPNISGKTVVRIQTNSPEGDDTVHTNTVSGAFVETGAIGSMDGGSTMTSHYFKGDFNASRSSSTYQDNAPVQQEAVQYPYYIQVATGIEETLPAIREYKTNVPYVLGDSKYSEASPYNASWLVSNGQYNAKSTYPDMWTQLQVELNSSLNEGDTVVIDGKTYVKRGLPVVLSTDTITDYDWVVNTADSTFRLPLLDGSESIPDYNHPITALTGTVNNEGQTFTAPANGLMYQQVNIASGNSIAFLVNGAIINNAYNANSQFSTGNFAEVKRGDVCHLLVGYGSGTGTIENCVLYPFVGNGNLYYYVGDTVQDASLINAGAVLGQLSKKADIDASNFNADGKSLLSGLGMPSSRYVDLTLGASGSTYTAPANGWFVFDKASTAANQYAALYNTGKSADISTLKSIAQMVIPIASSNLGLTIPALKGDIVHLDYTLAGKAFAWRFIYAEGEN